MDSRMVLGLMSCSSSSSSVHWLWVVVAGWMDDQRFYIRHISQQGEDGQIVYKLLRRLGVPLDFESKNGTAAIRQVFLV